MDREQTAEAIKVMQSWLDGKDIQCRPKGGDWYDIHEAGWAWNVCEFRIKPEPREFYISWDDKEGGPDNGWVETFASSSYQHSIKVREVL